MGTDAGDRGQRTMARTGDGMVHRMKREWGLYGMGRETGDGGRGTGTGDGRRGTGGRGTRGQGRGHGSGRARLSNRDRCSGEADICTYMYVVLAGRLSGLSPPQVPGTGVLNMVSWRSPQPFPIIISSPSPRPTPSPSRSPRPTPIHLLPGR